MDFSEALNYLKDGDSVVRMGWNGKGMWITMYIPDDDDETAMPFIYMKTADDMIVPWTASQTDLLADDWVLADDESADIYDVDFS